MVSNYRELLEGEHLMGDERIEIEKPQGHHCFACGTDNPIGLNLQFYRAGEVVCSEITLKKVHEGWEGIGHGGIVTTLLDEVMSWSLMYAKRAFLVTRSIQIKYIRPVLIGTPLKVTGWLVDDSTHPKIKSEGEIRDDRGGLLVRGVAEYVVLPKEKFSQLPEGYRAEMEALFKRFGER